MSRECAGCLSLTLLPHGAGAMSKKKAKLRVEYVKSMIGYPGPQKGTLRALGLKRLGDVVEVEDNNVMRGMLRKVSHLIQVQEVK